MIKSISFWEKEYFNKSYDLIIIGAGFVGLSAAIHYKESNPLKEVLLLERGVISYGASTRNAGFSCFGSVGELNDDLNNNPLSIVVETVKRRYKGLQLLRSIIPDSIMDYNESGSLELFNSESSYLKAASKIEFWNNALQFLNDEAIFQTVDQSQNGFYKKAISNPFEGQLNPKKAVNYLVSKARSIGVVCHFGMEVKNWERVASKYRVNAKEGLNFLGKELLLATNAFTNRLLDVEDVLPARNQVLITEEIEDLSWKGCFHVDKGYIYFRNVGKRILLGGARNISTLEGVDEYGNTKEIQEYLSYYLKERIMNGRDIAIDSWWSGIIAVGQEKTPIIKQLETGEHIAVRLGGMGVAIGCLVGKQASELIIRNEA